MLIEVTIHAQKYPNITLMKLFGNLLKCFRDSYMWCRAIKKYE